MNTFSPIQIDEYTKINAAIATSVCSCVLKGTERVGAVGHLPAHFLAGCSKTCLYSENRTVVRAEHLFEKNPEFLPLMHLPMHGLAVREDGGWNLGIFEHHSDIKDMDGKFFVQRTVDNFLEKDDKIYTLFTFGGLHYEALQTGARVVPVWPDFRSARDYVRPLHFLSRTLLRVKELNRKSLVDIALSDDHNYLALNHSSVTREAIIIRKRLNFFENTMQL